ncbi:CBS domain-containing protein [Methanobacterium formicicum]|uniref:Signal transduction protein with CBS domains n=1 Tax=Methanobacterium formicicum (strain DSM 3637 / PP1) TaxID=1204725 RepID=K2RF88_METFP|nr:CBS domain-containing protein [Methanobacterium formicicum]EKF87059.1 signal transduction protein with CBS domains [Methanobacterium formicicum DSM 3637]
MLTTVQKEILQVLIDLYSKSNYMPIKGENIASIMNRNPGTIRNQMQSLRSMGIVKGVPGPRGGYKPTLDAYHALNLSTADEEETVPLFKKDKLVENITVTRIEFTSLPQPGDCEATITVMGDIKQLALGDKVRVGPSPVNKLVVNGIIVGRDDMDGVLLLDVKDIRSIPHKSVLEIASQDLITLDRDMNIKEAAWILSNNGIDGAPVVENDNVMGMLTLIDITKAIANEETDLNITNLMSKYIITVKQDVMIAEAIQIMNKNKIGRLIITDEKDKPVGILTKTDILNQVSGLKYLTN